MFTSPPPQLNITICTSCFGCCHFCFAEIVLQCCILRHQPWCSPFVPLSSTKFCPPRPAQGCYKLSHTVGLMFTWSDQCYTEIFFIFCSSSTTKILSLMLSCSEFMRSGLASQIHAHAPSQQACSASTPCNP